MSTVKKTSIILFIIFISLSAKAQEIIEPALVKWYTIEEAEALNKKQPRTMYIDMYTDWCGWCKHMMKTTFAHKYIATYINNNFYPVRFDAEGKDTVKFQGKTWVNKDTTNKKSKHDLAIYLMNGRMSFPTIVYLEPDGTKTPVPGYKNVKQQEPLLYFFAEKINKSTSYSVFEKNFTMAFAGDTLEGRTKATSGKVKWYTMNEALEAQKKNPKKIFVDIYGAMYVKTRIMDSVVYQNPKVAELLNKHFYPVHFNAAGQEKVNFKGHEFTNQGQGAFSLHQFAGYLMGRQIGFSTFVFFDEKLNAISKLQGYLAPEKLSKILNYFGTDKYKTKKWEEFVKEIN